MKKSNFRLKIITHKIKYSIPGFIVSILVQCFIGYAFKYNLFFYVFYPLVYLGTLTNMGYGGLKALYFLSQIIYTAVIVYYSFKVLPIPNIELLKCPYCRENIEIFYRWFCSSCNKTQLSPSYITGRCDKCKNVSATFCCEKCEKEFLL